MDFGSAPNPLEGSPLARSIRRLALGHLHDCDIDITDVAFVAYHYGTVAGGPNWNPLADLNGDGRVDILDIALVASNFGQAIGPTDINHDCVINIIDVADISFWYGFGT